MPTRNDHLPLLASLALFGVAGCGPRPTRIVSAPTRHAVVAVSHSSVATPSPSSTSPQPFAASAAPIIASHGCTPGVRARNGNERVFFVASTDGIREMSADGAVLRILTTTAADRPRFTNHSRALVFLAVGESQVRRIDVESCAESVVATLPRGVSAECGGLFRPGYDPTQFVQSDDDVRITADGSALCLRVLDRNENMMSVEIQLRVPLHGGEVQSATLTSESCGSMTDAQREALPCTATLQAVTPRRRPSGADFPFALRVRDIARGNRVVATIGDEVSSEATSPSGRWIVFSARAATNC